MHGGGGNQTGMCLGGSPSSQILTGAAHPLSGVRGCFFTSHNVNECYLRPHPSTITIMSTVTLTPYALTPPPSPFLFTLTPHTHTHTLAPTCTGIRALAFLPETATPRLQLQLHWEDVVSTPGQRQRVETPREERRAPSGPALHSPPPARSGTRSSRGDLRP